MPKRGGRKKHRGGAPKEGARVAQPASLKKRHGKVHKFNNADQQEYDKFIEQSLETADRKRTRRGLGSKRQSMKEEALYTGQVGFRQGISYRNWPVEFVKSSEVYNPNRLVESLSGLKVESDEDLILETNMSIIGLNGDLSDVSEEITNELSGEESTELFDDELSESDDEQVFPSGNEQSYAIVPEDSEEEEDDDVDDYEEDDEEEPSFIIDVDGDDSLEESNGPRWVGSIKPYYAKDEDSPPYVSSSSNFVAGQSNRGFRTINDYQALVDDDENEGETTAGIADDELSVQNISRAAFSDITIPGDDMLDSDIDISDLAKLQSRDLDVMDAAAADFYMRIRESRVGADGPQHYVMLEGEENWVEEEELLESLQATLSISRANAYGIILQSGGTDYGQAGSDSDDEASYYDQSEDSADDDDDEDDIDAVIASLISEDGSSKRGRKRQENILDSFSEPSQPQYKGKGKSKVPNFGSGLDPELHDYLGQQWLKSRAAKAERKKQRETMRQEGKLSRHYRQSGDVLLADIYTTAMTFDQINLAIVDFLHNEELTTLSFPPMGFKERDLLKEIAACYKLQAKSLMDKKRNKFIGMIKKDLTTSDPNETRLGKLRQKKDWYPRSDVGMSRGKMIGLNRRDHARSSTDRRTKSLPKMGRSRDGGGGNAHREGDVVGSEAKEIESENIGRQLLERMGWKTGMGLGASKTGITVPVAATVKLSKRGLGNTQ